MASQVEIVNRALDKLGSKKPVVSLTDDQTTQSNLALRLYDILRKKELSAHYWAFARERTTLAPDTVGPSFGYTYYYELPADFLRLYKFCSSYDYTIEGRKILTDAGPALNIIYIKDVTNTELFDPLFVEGFAASMEAEMAEPITQSNAKKRSAQIEYKAVIAQAKLMDAIQQPPEDLEDGSWIESRL